MRTGAVPLTSKMLAACLSSEGPGTDPAPGEWGTQRVKASERAVIARDADGVIIGWNAGAEHLFGYEAAEVLGLSIRRLIPDADLRHEDELLARLTRGEAVEPIVVSHVHKDGRHIPVRVAVAMAHDVAGKPAVITEVAGPDVDAVTTVDVPAERPRGGRINARIRNVDLSLASLPYGAILIDSNG